MSESKTVNRKEVIAQAQKLAKQIAETEEVAFFKEAERKVNENTRVQELIQQIKNHQKHAVQFEHYDKQKSLSKSEKKLDELHNELDDIPVVQEFKQSQKEVNDLLQMVTHIISNKVTEEIIRSTGGNPLSGKTGSSPPPSCSIR